MISALAVVETQDIGAGVVIHPFAVVRKDVHLGDGVIVHPHVVIEPGVSVGDFVEIFSGAILGKAPSPTAALSRAVSFERRVEIGAHASIGPHAVIYYNVRIGAHTLVGDAASIREECVIGERAIVGRHVTINYAVTIGDRTKIMDHTWLAGNMVIGSDVFISGGVLTANDNNLGRSGYDAEHAAGPTIEDGAQIGVGAKLLPGVVIGRAATVAAGALVTVDVEPGALVMGIPARVVRRG